MYWYRSQPHLSCMERWSGVSVICSPSENCRSARLQHQPQTTVQLPSLCIATIKKLSVAKSDERGKSSWCYLRCEPEIGKPQHYTKEKSWHLPKWWCFGVYVLSIWWDILKLFVVSYIKKKKLRWCPHDLNSFKNVVANVPGSFDSVYFW